MVDLATHTILQSFDKDFAKLKPTDKHTTKPGPAVADMASIFFNLTFSRISLSSSNGWRSYFKFEIST